MKELRIGSLLQDEKYKIIGTLGQGGFGITYLAEQVVLHRKVAIKEFFMKEYCERDDSTSQVTLGTTTGSKDLVLRFRAKFIREAQMIASLEHPNIVKIHDIFEENGTAYYVMSYLEGDSLSDRVKKNGPLLEKDALRYIRQVTSALSYIHGRNSLHFDVKPSNILVNSADEAVLIDFGISKHYDESGSQTSSTPVGVSTGYAPLEQYQQNEISTFTPATDIYALGATLYTLLTGVVPPSAAEVNEEGLPPISAKISKATRDAITKAMQPRRKDRPQSMKEFLSLLDGVSDDPTTIIDNPKPQSKPKPEPKVEPEPKPEPQPKLTLNPTIKSLLKLLLIALAGFAIIFVWGLPRLLLLAWAGLAALIVFILWLLNRTNDKSGPISLLLAWAGLIALFFLVLWFSNRKNDDITATEDDTEVVADSIASSQTFTVNGVNFRMINVEGGTFQMGSTTGDSDEKPVHQVTLSTYYIGETEVTQALWQAVMGSNPSKFKGESRPVEQVSWDDCQTFIRKLNTLTGKTFRLPTEAEWEFAARGGNKSQGYKYSGSDDLGNVAWYSDNSGDETHPVKTKSPNELGIYDMSGNVAEWCQDWYGSSYYSDSPASNPTGPTSGSYRVDRGGSWGNSDSFCRVALRDWDYPSLTYNNLGLRLVF